jgi:hypothetical protein
MVYYNPQRAAKPPCGTIASRPAGETGDMVYYNPLKIRASAVVATTEKESRNIYE